MALEPSWPDLPRRRPVLALQALDPPATRDHAELLAWARLQGRPTSARTAHLVIEAAHGASVAPGDPPHRWSRVRVYEFLRSHLMNHCATRYGEAAPADAAEVLWTYLSWLHDTGCLDAESDDLSELRQPLYCFGGLDTSGRLSPAGAGSFALARRAPCECFVPTARQLRREPWRADAAPRRRRAG